MRFFHVSDLHIGMRLNRYDLQPDQQYVLQEMIEKAREYRPDAFVIAGDVYDKAVPSAEAVHLFNWFITTLSENCPDMELLVIRGNHDSAERMDCYRSILARQKVHIVGMPPRQKEEAMECVRLTDEYGEVRFYLMPFIKPSMVKPLFDEEISSYDEAVQKMLARENIDTSVRNVIVSHQFYVNAGEEAERMASEVITVGNVDSVSAAYLKPFEYAALGHLHKPMKVGCEEIRYCGTPMPYSVDECDQQKEMLCVTLTEKGNPPQIEAIPLTPLRKIRKIKGTLEEVLPLSCEDYVSVTLTDQYDLDTLSMQERLRQAFPYLLEIKRERQISSSLTEWEEEDLEKVSPYEMFCRFMEDMTEEEQEVLKDVINDVL